MGESNSSSDSSSYSNNASKAGANKSNGVFGQGMFGQSRPGQRFPSQQKFNFVFTRVTNGNYKKFLFNRFCFKINLANPTAM